MVLALRIRRLLRILLVDLVDLTLPSGLLILVLLDLLLRQKRLLPQNLQPRLILLQSDLLGVLVRIKVTLSETTLLNEFLKDRFYHGLEVKINTHRLLSRSEETHSMLSQFIPGSESLTGVLSGLFL